MKKLFVFFAILFASVFTSVTMVGQTKIFNAQVYLNGVTNGFVVASNPNSVTAPQGAGTLIVTFTTPQVITNVDFSAVLTNPSTPEYTYIGSGVIMIKITHYGFKVGSATMTSSGIYTIPTQADVDNAYSSGFTAGVSSATVNVNDYELGFQAGKSTCGTSTGVAKTASEMGVSVYPSPATRNSTITVSCPDFKQVTVLNLNGTVVGTYTTSEITAPSTSGIYVLNVQDNMGNVSPTKIVVQ